MSAPVIKRHIDGSLDITWPYGRPKVVEVDPDVIEGWVEMVNRLVVEANRSRFERAMRGAA